MEHLDESVTNAIASACLFGRLKDAIGVSKRTENNTHELEYNIACTNILQCNFDEALKHLIFAQRNYRTHMSNSFSHAHWTTT